MAVSTLMTLILKANGLGRGRGPRDSLLLMTMLVIPFNLKTDELNCDLRGLRMQRLLAVLPRGDVL